MLAHLADVSVRSILLALIASFMLWITRSRRSVAWQHTIWTAVVCGMLALFVFGQGLPRLHLRVIADSVDKKPSSVVAPDVLIIHDTPVTPRVAAATKVQRGIDWREVALVVYAVIGLAFLAQFLAGMFLALRLLARSRRVGGFSESELISVPVTIGWVRPRIVLPVEWRTWDGQKLEAVLTHERAHVRRRDGLTAMLAGVNRCIFWFHPLAWWVERRLALLAERACDESCVAMLGNREWYAQLLLDMTGAVDPRQGRLQRHALTMAAKSHIAQRIEALLQERRTFSRGLSRAGWAVVALFGIPLVWGAATVELDREPALLRLEILRWAPLPPIVDRKPTVMAQVRPAEQVSVSPPAERPKFDAASVKPCAPGDGNGKAGRGGGGGRGFGISPGRLWVTCMSVAAMIDIAYVQFGNNPLINDSRAMSPADRLRGGPGWMRSDWYTIEAVTDNPVANGPTAGGRELPAASMLRGPMLQALLEDRFQLKTHRETEEAPMYALTEAKGGLKIRPSEEGSCRPHEPGTPMDMSDIAGQKPWCLMHTGWEGPNWTVEATGQTPGALARMLSGVIMSREVIDRTGVTSVFDFHLVFAHDEDAPGSFPTEMRSPFAEADGPAGQSVFTALGQLGLKLEPIKGPRGYIVVDRVERPSEN